MLVGRLVEARHDRSEVTGEHLRQRDIGPAVARVPLADVAGAPAVHQVDERIRVAGIDNGSRRRGHWGVPSSR